MSKPRSSSPFASLASLRDRLPEGDAPVESPAAASTSDGPSVPRKLVVRRERTGRRGKTVTRISGFGATVAGDALQTWARRMKRELGCGGSVEDEDIILAGDLVERAARWLEAAGVSRVVRGN